MEHEFINQETIGQLLAGIVSGLLFEHQSCRVALSVTSYLAHGITGGQRIGEEQVALWSENPVALAAAA